MVILLLDLFPNLFPIQQKLVSLPVSSKGNSLNLVCWGIEPLQTSEGGSVECFGIEPRTPPAVGHIAPLWSPQTAPTTRR